MKKVALVMGSDSDLPVLEPAIDTLRTLGIPFEVRVISAHRTPAQAADFAKGAAGNGFGVLIAAAGKAAHLAGALAANTLLPVIGIPVQAGGLGGLDALLSTVQMPAGVPVAAVAVNGAQNAALLAAQILALGEEALFAKLCGQRAAMEQAAQEKDAPHTGTLFAGLSDRSCYYLRIKEKSMEKKAQIYEGKAKKVYETSDENLYIVSYKDDATAFNGEKRGTILGKGAINNRVSNHLMKLLEQNGIPTHLVKELSDTETLVKRVKIVPLEVIVRNIAAGSLSKRLGLPEGTPMKSPVLEYCYKDDSLGDPIGERIPYFCPGSCHRGGSYKNRRVLVQDQRDPARLSQGGWAGAGGFQAGIRQDARGRADTG